MLLTHETTIVLNKNARHCRTHVLCGLQALECLAIMREKQL